VNYRAFLAALLIMCGAAQGATDTRKFDLRCDGTKTMSISKASEPWSLRYRVDLANLTFCTGTAEQCNGPFSIAKVEPSEIVFQNDRTTYSWIEARVDRTSGALTQRVGFFLPAMVGESFTVSASCTRAPFSGLPPTKF
jgi:hypothetical protein